jgi:hypothetical protein
MSLACSTIPWLAVPLHNATALLLLCLRADAQTDQLCVYAMHMHVHMQCMHVCGCTRQELQQTMIAAALHTLPVTSACQLHSSMAQCQGMRYCMQLHAHANSCDRRSMQRPYAHCLPGSLCLPATQPVGPCTAAVVLPQLLQAPAHASTLTVFCTDAIQPDRQTAMAITFSKN